MASRTSAKASGMHLRMVYPLPLMLKDVFAKYKKVVTIEVAFGDELKPSPLALLLRSHTLVDIKPLISNCFNIANSSYRDTPYQIPKKNEHTLI